MIAADRPRVLVTRAEPGASRTAAALADAGLEPVVMPFTQAVALPVRRDLVAAARACDGVAVTSARALTLAPPDVIEALRGKQVFAVGDATADVAAEHTASVVSADGDADALAALIEETVPPAHSIAYLCGRIRTGGLERRLSASGRRFTIIETYDMVQVSRLTDKIDALARQHPPEAVLFHSGVIAQCFIDSADQADLWESFEKTVFLVISKRVAQLFERHPPALVMVADAPRDDALVALAHRRFALD